MNNAKITSIIKRKIKDTGIKLTAVSLKTGISYQRLQRVFNQNAVLSATELIILCLFFGLDISDFRVISGNNNQKDAKAG